MASLHISISAEKFTEIAGFPLTNSMITSMVVSGLLIAFALWVRASLKKTNKPSGIQNVAEWIVESLDGLVHSVTQNRKKTDLFFPFVATFFLFIMLNNWAGLLPGVGTIGKYEEKAHAQAPVEHPMAQAMQVYAVEDAGHTSVAQEDHTDPADPHAPAVDHATTTAGDAHAEESHAPAQKVFVPLFRAGTADLNMTLALGFMSVALVQIFGVMHLGGSYFKKFLNFSNPINTFVGILEIVSEFSRVISFAFRLFGNVFAGEVLLAVIGFLVPVILPMPFYGLEIFVGFIQALVFAMLSVVLYNMATVSHDEHH